MKKHAIIILLCFSNFIQAQENYSWDHDDYFQRYDSQYQTNSNANKQDKESTPSQDAINQNNKENANPEKSNPDNISTPSKDAATTTSQINEKEKTQKDNENKGKEADKKEEKKEKKEEEKPKSPHTFTSNVSIVSDYRFRGISQTMRRPAIQGGFDYSHSNGFYLGTWASNVSGSTNFYNNTCMEWDLYGGYKNKLFPCLIPDLVYNVGLIYYYYPGGKTHARRSVPYNTAELYIEFTYKWFDIKFWQTFTNYFGICSKNPPFNWEKNRSDRPNGSSRGSTNVELSFNFELMKKVCFRCFEGGKLTLLLLIGHQTVRNYEHLSCTHWRATLTQEFAWFNVFLTYVGTNARHAYFDVPDNSFHSEKRHLGAQGVVVGMIRSF